MLDNYKCMVLERCALVSHATACALRQTFGGLYLIACKSATQRCHQKDHTAMKASGWCADLIYFWILESIYFSEPAIPAAKNLFVMFMLKKLSSSDICCATSLTFCCLGPHAPQSCPSVSPTLPANRMLLHYLTCQLAGQI